MSAPLLRLLAVCFVALGVTTACGKKDDPPAEPADEASEDSAAAATDDTGDEDASAGEDAEDEAKRPLTLGERQQKLRRERARLAGQDPKDAANAKPRLERRLPGRDLETGEEGEGGDAEDGDAATEAGTADAGPEVGEDPAPKPGKIALAQAPDPKEPKADGDPKAPEADTEPDDPKADADPKDPAAKAAPGTPDPTAGPTPKGRANRPPPRAAPPFDVASLMPLETVTSITKAKGLSEGGVLPGIAIGPSYGSAYYHTSKDTDFGIAVQAWKDPARREADDRFRRMRLQYPNAEDIQVMPAKAFFAHFSGIQMLTFVDSVKRVVVTISCSEKICSHEQLTRLAKAVKQRL